VASHWTKYKEGCPDGKGEDWRVAKSIFVSDSEQTAKEYGHGASGPYHFYFKQLIRKLVGLGGRGNLFKLDQSEPDSGITADTVTPKLVIAGTVNSVVEQILAFREKVGPFGTLYYPCHDWVDPKLAKRSMELMAEKVMPKVNEALRR
jgi:alkanesulfonate monooxygenase SsuD/methylene tetrahydromethanopterin reductase-like flavin-dependent oxidoreductase (luciferase family)